MLTWARLFVFVVYSILGASFLATTGVLAWEFGNSLWLDFASVYSHLFIFFPTLGIVALVAFYVPSVIFVDLYWRRVRFGKVRFLFGFFVVAVASYLIAGVMLANPRHGIWESAPRVLAADEGDPAGCSTRSPSCQRMPALTALRNLRSVSRERFAFEGLIRDCSGGPKDALIERAHEGQPKRFCFASTPLTSPPLFQSDEDCCKAQAKLISTVQANSTGASTRSVTSEVHARFCYH